MYLAYSSNQPVDNTSVHDTYKNIFWYESSSTEHHYPFQKLKSQYLHRPIVKSETNVQNLYNF